MPATVKIRLPYGDVGAWPAAAVAGTILTGWLPSVETEEELQEAVRQFFRLLDGGIVDRAAWEYETRTVIRHILAWGEAQARAELAESHRWN